MTDRSQWVKDLSPQKLELLLQRLKQKENTPSQRGIQRQGRTSPSFPLSFAQQRLWFLDQLMPNDPTYNILEAFRIQGPLNTNALQQTLDAIVSRHEILRTTFASVDGTPFQIIHEHLPVALSVTDLYEYPESSRDSQAQSLLIKEGRRPFDLVNGPLLRILLLQLHEQEYILLLTFHHIIYDGWSTSVLTQEISVYYEAFICEVVPQIPELRIQYVDYAIWQREKLQGIFLEDQISYWKQQLAGVPLLQLPTDYPRPLTQTFNGKGQSLVLSQDLSESLKTLSQEEGVTLFMTLLAAFNVLLARYTGQKDIPVGTLVAGRERTELEGLIGFFVNTLIVRTDLSGNLSFQEILKRTSEVCLEAFAHQDLPFEKLVEALHLERDVSRTPLFQVLFILQNTPQSISQLSDLTLYSLELDTRTAPFDLSVFIGDNDGRLDIEVLYNTDLFSSITIARFLDHFQVLLTAIVTDSKQRLLELPLLTSAEKQQILVEWNDTHQDYNSNICMHQLFELQVEQTPDSVAAIFEGYHITYGELNRRANQLAHYLQSLGIAPGESVGICIDRSLEMLIGVIAVLKAGGAYIPLDPAYPSKRLAFMLEDSHIRIVLVEERLEQMMPSGIYLICPRSMHDRIAQASGENLHNPVTARDLAYIMYTSGSTGTPKGVQIEHVAVINFLQSMSQYPGLKRQDIFLAITSLSFDIAGLELFLPLLKGACLIIASREVAIAGNLLMQQLTESGATIMQATPSAWRLLLEAGWQGISQLTILCGGEPLHRDLAAQLLGRGVALWNLYGPTETTIWSTIHQLTSIDEPVLIGHPIANTEVYILNASLEPVPVGVVGEIYLGGHGLSRGYFGQPTLTAERFLPHPFSQEPGMRLYRTGDLARYLSNGAIEHLGRLDEQVKVRGFRIELGEIETVLNQHSAVRASVLAARENQFGLKHLVAYIVPKSSDQDSEHQQPTLKSSYDQIEEWQMVMDEIYTGSPNLDDPTFNTSGWISSYTGSLIPPEEMHELANQTIKLLLALRPSRVLEIGTGTGLLSFGLAPFCTEYWGTDFSSVALQALQNLVTERKLSNMRLLLRNADDFSGILAEQHGTFDAIILNSVVQYFSDVDYLLRVLEGAIQLIAPGGFIFVGDVRNLALLEAFQVSLQLYKAAPTLSTSQLQALIQKRVARENELIIDPAFFFALQQRQPRISQVEIQLKHGRYHNELTRFRYNVLLHIEHAITPINISPALDWREEQLTLPTFQELLAKQQPEILHISHVPNTRVLSAIKALSLLHNETSLLNTVSAIREAVNVDGKEQGIDPEDIWDLAEALPYYISVTYSTPDSPECFDALLIRHSMLTEGYPAYLPPHLQIRTVEPEKPWSAYTNLPFKAQYASNLIPELRTYLKEKLPDYMIPSDFILMDTLPLTPNGKVDRHLLPAPEQPEPQSTVMFATPRTNTEHILAQIWTQVLGAEQIGIYNNFFHLGGDSLLVIRVLSKANQAGFNLTAKQLFQHPTIASLASVMSTTELIAEQDLGIGNVPFTPSQSWFLELEYLHPQYYNIAFMLEADGVINYALVERTITALLLKHASLRLRLIQEGKHQYLTVVAPDETPPCRRIDVTSLPPSEQDLAIDSIITELQANFDLARASLFQVVFFERGPDKSSYVLLVGHYLLADLLSWQILLEDFTITYQQLKEEGQLRLSSKTTSVKQWVERLIEYTHSEAIQSEQAYWLAPSRQQVSPLPVDFPAGRNTVASSRSIVIQFDIEETQILLQVLPIAYDTRTDVILLTALMLAFARWSGSSSLLIELLGHGREPLFEDMDVSRTIGSLNATFPVLLDIGRATTEREALQLIKAQMRQIPNHGIGYGMLRYLSTDELSARFRAMPEPQVYFNYVGVTPEISKFQVVRAFGGHHLDQQAIRPRLLEISCMSIKDGYINIEIEYSHSIHEASTIEKVGKYIVEVLRELVISSPMQVKETQEWGKKTTILTTSTPLTSM